MKLATLKNNTRDGRLVVVSRDLTRMTDASFLARTLQAALDDWMRIAPHLETLAESLEHGSVPSERFHEHDAMSPLPRAYGWLTGPAYNTDAEPAREAPMPERSGADPVMSWGGSDAFLSSRDPIPLADEAWQLDAEAGIAVILDDVPMGAGASGTREAIRLVMLVNAMSLRGHAVDDPARDPGRLLSKPSPAFSPVAVTPDELGKAWDGARLHLPLHLDLNGRPFGRTRVGAGEAFDFPALIAQAAGTRPLGAGVIIGSGALADGRDGSSGRPVQSGEAGYPSIAELRANEAIVHGTLRTPFMKAGDIVRIEMPDEKHHSIFGAIEQTVEAYPRR